MQLCAYLEGMHYGFAGDVGDVTRLVGVNVAGGEAVIGMSEWRETEMVNVRR